MKEECNFNTSNTNNLSAVYIQFIDQNSHTFTPDIVNISSGRGQSVGELMLVTSNYFQSFSVNDFVDFTNYNPTNGPVTLQIWQTGQFNGSAVPIDIYKIAFGLDWSIITTTSSGITGPASVTASSGPHP